MFLATSSNFTGIFHSDTGWAMSVHLFAGFVPLTFCFSVWSKVAITVAVIVINVTGVVVDSFILIEASGELGVEIVYPLVKICN